MTELDRIINTRRSIRKFKNDIPAQDLVDQVIEAGLEAPTGRNMQSSVIIEIKDPQMQAKIREVNARIMGVPPPGRPADPFYSAPVILLVIASKKSPTAVYDGALALGHMMLKAHELGLASCWIHRAKEEMESPLGKEILARANLDGDYEGVGHLALGYADMPLPAPHVPDPARKRVI